MDFSEESNTSGLDLHVTAEFILVRQIRYFSVCGTLYLWVYECEGRRNISVWLTSNFHNQPFRHVEEKEHTVSTIEHTLEKILYEGRADVLRKDEYSGDGFRGGESVSWVAMLDEGLLGVEERQDERALDKGRNFESRKGEGKRLKTEKNLDDQGTIRGQFICRPWSLFPR